MQQYNPINWLFKKNNNKKPKKKKKKKTKKHTKTLYFAYVWRRPVQPIVMIFGPARDPANVINRAKFYIDQSKGFGSSKGQILVSHRKPQWLLPLCVALTCTRDSSRLVARLFERVILPVWCRLPCIRWVTIKIVQCFGLWVVGKTEKVTLYVGERSVAGRPQPYLAVGRCHGRNQTGKSLSSGIWGLGSVHRKK